MAEKNYVGRFAPSPTGPLHAGSLVAAMASYLDAKTHGGKWLVRIEDIDEARTAQGAEESILHMLTSLGMEWNDEPVRQSSRHVRYQAALDTLGARVYPCGCSRREIADSRIGAAADGGMLYPGTCRAGLASGKSARALRLRVPDRGDPEESITFEDRWRGSVTQHLAAETGDFVLKRADGFWAYQLAVVVDDADQKVTDVVRGADLIDSTSRQIYLQRLLGFPTPRYMHVPIMANERGEKLSKQTGAQPLDVTQPLVTLNATASFLGLEIANPRTPGEFWAQAVQRWTERFGNR